MIYITGDTHGDQHEWQSIDALLQPGDTIIIAGDFGYLWSGSRSEKEFFDQLAEKPYTVLFVDGNHENFTKLNAYPIERWHGGRVHFLRRNLIHLMRGEVYEVDGKRVFVFGGGYSIDRARRKPRVSWWPEELPSEEEYQNAEIRLREADRRVDYIITHTAPAESVFYLSCIPKYGIRSDVTEDARLTVFLDRVADEIGYLKWYFGHYHVAHTGKRRYRIEQGGSDETRLHIPALGRSDPDRAQSRRQPAAGAAAPGGRSGEGSRLAVLPVPACCPAG